MYCSLRVRRKDIVSFAIVITTIISCFLSSLYYTKAYQTNSQTGLTLPVLMYHSVCYNKVNSEFIIKPEVFESDMLYLKEHGYTSISALELIDYVYNNTPLPEKPVLITLDDGHLNNLTYVLPLLEKHDMKAIVSVVGIYTERDSENKETNPAYSYLNWSQIKLLNDSDRVEIGNHTYNMHQLATRRGCTQNSGETNEEYSEKLTSDLSKLQNLLTEKSGITPYVFAYPYGFISKNSITVIKQMGFKISFSCKEKINFINSGDPDCLFGLYRFNRVSGKSTVDFMNANNIL